MTRYQAQKVWAAVQSNFTEFVDVACSLFYDLTESDRFTVILKHVLIFSKGIILVDTQRICGSGISKCSIS